MAAPTKLGLGVKFALKRKTHQFLSNLCLHACSGRQLSVIGSARYAGWLTSLTSPTKTNVKFFCNASSSVSSPTPLILTPNSIKQMKVILDEGEYLRIAVDGGGCSGFQYSFSVDSKIDPDDDCVLEVEGGRVIVDRTSLDYLKGSTIDYSQELIRSAFRVQHNPQAEQGCSCGSSFAKLYSRNKKGPSP